MANCLYISQVLQATGSEFVDDEVRSGDVPCGKIAINQQLLTVPVDGSEVDACNLLEDIETIRWVAESLVMRGCA